jgi:hypothetical protein
MLLQSFRNRTFPQNPSTNFPIFIKISQSPSTNPHFPVIFRARGSPGSGASDRPAVVHRPRRQEEAELFALQAQAAKARLQMVEEIEVAKIAKETNWVWINTY